MIYDANARRAYKEKAKSAIQLAFWPSMLAVVIYLLPSVFATAAFQIAMQPVLSNQQMDQMEALYSYIPSAGLLSLVQIFIFSPLLMGLYTFFTKRVRQLDGAPAPAITDMFSYFESLSAYLLSVRLTLVLMVYAVLWSLLFIPAIFVGVILLVLLGPIGMLLYLIGLIPLSIFITAKLRSYDGAYILLAEHPEMGAMAAAAESAQIFKGRLWELFVFDLSFILWSIASVLSLGVVGVYYTAYQSSAFVCYLDGLQRGPAEPAPQTGIQ